MYIPNSHRDKGTSQNCNLDGNAENIKCSRYNFFLLIIENLAIIYVGTYIMMTTNSICIGYLFNLTSKCQSTFFFLLFRGFFIKQQIDKYIFLKNYRCIPIDTYVIQIYTGTYIYRYCILWSALFFADRY